MAVSLCTQCECVSVHANIRELNCAWQAIERIDLICDKSIALKYGILQDLVDEFHIQRRHISSFKDETVANLARAGTRRAPAHACVRFVCEPKFVIGAEVVSLVV